MNNHTKGPWVGQVSENSDGDITTDIKSKADGIYGYTVASDIENDADLNLFLASPELLEAAQNAVLALMMANDNTGTIAMLRAAIAKAKGE